MLGNSYLNKKGTPSGVISGDFVSHSKISNKRLSMSYYFDIFTKQCDTISFYCKNVTQNVTQNLVVSHIIIIFASQT